MTTPRRRSVVALALAGVLLGAVSVAAALAAPFASVATPYSYVALGDSFSAGEGIAPFLQSGPACHRSSRAYSTWVRPAGYPKPLYAIASGRSRAGRAAGPTCTARTRTCARRIGSCGRPSRARARRRRTSCHGASAACRRERPAATTARRRSTARPWPRANLVTLTLGGNDAGYVDVLVTCGLGNCNTRAFERSRAAIIARTKPRLEKVYRAIAAKAPHARILVLGYPHPFPAAKARQACPALSPFQGEQDMLRRLGTRLNGTIASAVADGRPLGCQDHVRPGGGQVRRPRGLRQQGRVDQRDRHELDRVRAESGLVPPDARWSARRVRGRDQRRAPALTGGYQRSSSSRAWASMSATIAAAGRTASSMPIDCPA